jgi:hypothetical protein
LVRIGRPAELVHEVLLLLLLLMLLLLPVVLLEQMLIELALEVVIQEDILVGCFG